jgi:hypothetical protein
VHHCADMSETRSSRDSAAAGSSRQAFSLGYGGPFDRLMLRIGVRRPGRSARYWWIPLILWAPIVAGELVRVLFGRSWDPMVLDLSLHARLLVTLPMLLASEVLIEGTTRSAITSMYEGKFCDRERLDRILAKAESLRDSWIAELVVLAVAIAGGQLVLWRLVGATGLFHGGTEGGFGTFSRVWYTLVALPIVQFVMFRWLWRWLIWSYMLWRISRQPLVVLATHADLAGGLAALARPVTAFSAFAIGISAILSGSWATQLIANRTTLTALLPMLTAFLLIALAVAVGPLLPLSPHLFRARRRTLALYGDFMRRYTLWFHGKWIERPPAEQERALGSPDIQSLADIGHAYQVASKTRVFVFGPRTVFLVWFAGILPMIPVFATTLTVEAVLKRILTTVLGGFPI